jgi:hypothetical protein
MVWACCKNRETTDTPKWPGKLECMEKDPKTPTDLGRRDTGDFIGKQN